MIDYDAYAQARRILMEPGASDSTGRLIQQVQAAACMYEMEILPEFDMAEAREYCNAIAD